MLIILAAAFIAFVLFFGRSVMTQDIQYLLKYLPKGMLVMAFLALIFLLFSGKVPAFFIGALALIPLTPYLRSVKSNNTEENSLESDSMSVKTALEVLGLPQDASKDRITTTHKKLIQKLHPDKGGSSYLASKINQARDVLLQK